MVEKLKETIDVVHNIFNKENEVSDEDTKESPNTTENATGTVPKELQDHFQDMTKGKIGKLAFELAEETAKNLNLDDNITNTQDIFSSLLKNPNKLMNIVQNMGSKLDEKMKSGDIDESEIMNEGMEMLSKMKDIPGFGDLNKMFGNIENLLNPVAQGQMKTKIEQTSKLQKTKERLHKKLAKKTQDPELAKIEDIKSMLSKSK